MIIDVPVKYIPGGAWAICDRCGFKVRLATLATEWTMLRVCPPCFDPTPPELTPPDIGAEGVPLPGARPEPPDQFIDPMNPVTVDDL